MSIRSTRKNPPPPFPIYFDLPSYLLDQTETQITNPYLSRTTIHAYGTVDLDLECKDETWVNPDWKIGQIYSSRTVTCDPVTLPLEPYQMEAVA